MELFNEIITTVNNIVWHPVMLVFLGFAAIWFTIRLGGFQFTGFKDMFKWLFDKGDDTEAKGLTGFQAFATTVGGRVGTGNIAGTATAIFMGGPGALFWMWMAALLGASTGMVECILGQIFKTRNLGELTGGPYYYMEKGLKNKKFGRVLAVLFCIAVFIGPGFLLPSMQTQTAATAVSNAFGAPMIVTGVLLVVLVGVVIMGGVTRVGQVAEFVAPIMCGVFFIIAIIIMVANASIVPSVFADIFTSAFGANSIYGGILGACVSWGIKRGFFSNDAGNGMSPIISATTNTSHPVKQGLVQGFSVYVDTILVCTCTGLSILCAGTYNVAADGVGNTLLVEQAPGVMYGISFMQEAIVSVVGHIGSVVMAIMLFVFIYTTMLSYAVQLESVCRYLFHANKKVVTFIRILYLVFILFGVLVDGSVIWSMGDIGVGCMLWVNTFACLLLTPVVVKTVKDYKKQKKLGMNPIFDPATVGVKDEAGVWNNYVKMKKARGDYENDELGY